MRIASGSGASRPAGTSPALVALVDDPELEGADGVTGPSSAVSAAVLFYPVTDVETLPPFHDAFPPEWIEELERAGGGAPVGADRRAARGFAVPARRRAASCHPCTMSRRRRRRSCSCTARPTASCRSGRASSCTAPSPTPDVEVELVRVPGADHVFLGTDPLPQLARAVEFLRARLSA